MKRHYEETLLVKLTTLENERSDQKIEEPLQKKLKSISLAHDPSTSCNYLFFNSLQFLRQENCRNDEQVPIFLYNESIFLYHWRLVCNKIYDDVYNNLDCKAHIEQVNEQVMLWKRKFSQTYEKQWYLLQQILVEALGAKCLLLLTVPWRENDSEFKLSIVQVSMINNLLQKCFLEGWIDPNVACKVVFQAAKQYMEELYENIKENECNIMFSPSLHDLYIFQLSAELMKSNTHLLSVQTLQQTFQKNLQEKWNDLSWIEKMEKHCPIHIRIVWRLTKK